MQGSVVNALAIIIGGFAGVFLKGLLQEKMGGAIMNAMALCVFYIGFKGALEGNNILITIISMIVGVIIGELLRLDDRLHRLGAWLENRFPKGEGLIAPGFVAASLLFCVGAMAIVGPLQSGLSGDNETLYIKSLLDGVAAIVLASSLGIGVIFSAFVVLIYEGSIALLAGFIEPFLGAAVISEITCVGYLLIIGLSFNMLKITKLKIMNFVPAVFIPLILSFFI